VKYAFIEQQRGIYPLRLLCRALAVSRSGYHAWRRARPGARELRDRELLAQIGRLHEASHRTYGSPRIHLALRRQGQHVSGKRVARLMRQSGLRGAYHPKRFHTNGAQPTWQDAGNELCRRFAPGRLSAWAADITCLHTGAGPLHLAVVLDLYTRRILGWSMAGRPHGELGSDALRAAQLREPPEPGMLVHSDRGGHFVSAAFRALLARAGQRQSLSRRGDCHDNAAVESFFATLKRELPRFGQLATHQQARQATFDFIEVFYNRERIHTSLEDNTPEESAIMLKRA